MKIQAKYIIYETERREEALGGRQIGDFNTVMLEYIDSLNVKKGRIPHLHICPVRDYSDELFEKLGSAAGSTATAQTIEIRGDLRDFLNTFTAEGRSSSTVSTYILSDDYDYCLAFPNVSIGLVWWFNDSFFGLEHQLNYVSSVDLLTTWDGERL